MFDLIKDTLDDNKFTDEELDDIISICKSKKEDSKPKKSCLNCSFCMLRDYGYSDWTVEGTNFHCAAQEHPDGVFDKFYGEEKKLQYADECRLYREGKGTHISVEGGLC